MFVDYTVLDFETSGLDPNTDYAIEVAMLRVRNREIVANDAFFIKPHKNFIVSSATTRLTGITQQNIDAGISPDDAFHRICSFLGQDCIVCHNTKFDMGFLMSMARRCNTPIRLPTYCTLALSRKAFPLLNTHKLAHLAKEFGLSPPAHRALADCQSAHELLQILEPKLEKRPSRKFYEHTHSPKSSRSFPRDQQQHVSDGEAWANDSNKKSPNTAVNIALHLAPFIAAAIVAILSKGNASILHLATAAVCVYLLIWVYRQFK